MKKAKLQQALACLACGLAVLLPSPIIHAQNIREVRATSGTLIPVHTALGFSTILEFQSKPISAVLGDQDAFHLEYLGNSITLKPIIQGAKTNLFVYSDVARFNFSIQTARSSNIDYIVHVLSKSIDAPTESKLTKKLDVPLFQTIPVNRKSNLAGFTLKIPAIKLNNEKSNPRSASLIEFELSSSKKDYSFQPASIGIKQSGSFIEIESLFLEKMELKAGEPPIHGVAAILNQEWTRSKPITFIFAIQRKDKKINRIEVTFSTFLTKTVKKEVKNGKPELFPTQSR